MYADFNIEQRIGILGGGQLGRMLIQAGIDLNLTFSVLDPDSNAPCAALSNFHQGKLTDYATVMDFGANCDLITIEIENVNTQALKDLCSQGKRVYPQPDVIELIQDKRKQKNFYKENGIPTADYILVENKEQVKQHTSFLPAVNKLGREGYDGRGVQILRTVHDFEKAFDAPGFLEKLVPFDKEIAIIVARNAFGEVKSFPAVEMVFHPEQNLVEYLYSPATISTTLSRKAEAVAIKIIEGLNMTGILAVEMFVLGNEVLVNEIAPRPHNSGHQTIEGNITSQYDQHLRSILGLPLGNTEIKIPSVMINLLGEPGFNGPAQYEGLKLILAMEGVHVHLYGKALTKPFRKMGHVTVVDHNRNRLMEKAKFVKHTLKVKA